ncbi:MAG: SdrD B-like domain-containing protein [Saprospiraceae bacterium]|nr:hypothetical protein [Candidatus Vicinibacter proximus]
MNRLLQITLFWLCLVMGKTTSQISGLVFRDYNSNGQRDSSSVYYEPGVKGVEVRITDRFGHAMDVLTNEKGIFTLNPLITPPYRLEFNPTKAYDFDGPMSPFGPGSSSSVQFIYKNNDFIYFGINYPQEYCFQPKIVTPCYVIGDPIAPNSTLGNYEALVNWDFHNGGTSYPGIVPIAQGGTAPNMEKLASAKEIGSCWGTVYSRNSDIIFTSAVLKRHAGIGPEGYGGLYMIRTKPQLQITSLDLNKIGVPSGGFPNNTERKLPIAFPPISADSLAFSQIGKISYGSIDLSEDGKTLYIISLYTRKLYSVYVNSPFTIPTSSDVDSFDIPDPGCNNGNFRPWALRQHRGKLYIGVVCDGSLSGSTSNDLTSNVYEFNPQSRSFKSILNFSFNYPSFGNKKSFFGWRDEWDPNCIESSIGFCDYPQPILSDIEFDGDDHMVLGIMDRYSLQGGVNQKNTNGTGAYSILPTGDILRASYNPLMDKFTLENNASDGVNQTDGRNTGFGPGGGEFYHGEFPLDEQGVKLGQEAASGALAECPGYGDVVTTATDPNGLFTNGVIHLNNKKGHWTKRYQVIPPDFTLFVGKSNALGDLKISSPPAPIEIGNYVWKDLNGNGIQDPIEPPIAGVTIQLVKNNVVIASAISNKRGNYLFSNAPVPTVNEHPNSFKYNIKELTRDSTYILRIPDYTSQSKVGVAIQTQNPSSYLPKIDNNATNVVGSDIDFEIMTDLDGHNDHSYDFGFYADSEGSVFDPIITVGPCNGITNGFDLTIEVDVVNSPVGDIMVELSTGEQKRVPAIPDGKLKFTLYNLQTSGIKNVGIKLYFINDTSIVFETANAFDQPDPCCNLQLNLCTNRDALVELVAVPGLVHYSWYDSTTQTLLGNLPTLILDKKSKGLEDNHESYYFVGINAHGDTIRQYCFYNLDVIECCNLTVNTFFQTTCNNNNTIYDPTDDWFAILINAENDEAGPTNRFEVVLNGMVLETSPYGTAVVVGDGINQNFKADGATTYKVLIRDADNHQCLDSIFTAPSSCPIPKISVTKVLQSNQIQSDASYAIVYHLQVKNTGTETGTYTLIDDPHFDDDAKVLTTFYTSDIPNRGGSALLGSGPWTLISNQSIAPGVVHNIYFHINLKLDFSPGSTGDNKYTKCGTSSSTHFSSGEGLFNRALLDFDANGSIDAIDTSCTDIPYITIDKELISSTQTGIKTYTLQYQLLVKNLGGANGIYNLIDRPGFDDDIHITSAEFSSNTGLNGMLSNVVPLNGWIIASAQSIAPFETDSFLVKLNVTMDFDQSTFGNNFYNPCGQINPLIPRVGEGIFNVASVDLNNDFKPEKRDTTCGDLSQITHKKSILSKNYLTDGALDILYLIRVVNSGGKSGIYSLTDRPSPDEDLINQSASVKINSGAYQILSTNPGTSGWTLASNRSLNAYGIDSFFIKLRYQIDLTSTSPGDKIYQFCQKDANGQFKEKYGLFNESQLEINQDNVIDQKDTACTDFEFYDLALKKICLASVPVRNKELVAFRIVVYNQGSQIARKISVTDYLSKAFDFDPFYNSGWVEINDSTYSYVIDSINAGDSINIDILVRTNYHLRQKSLSINSAEISSFLDKSFQETRDYDSTPDQNRNNDNTVLPGSNYDDLIYGRRKINPNEDEDDHDIAEVPFLDLALTKTVISLPPYKYYDTVSFKIVVYNQGNVVAKKIDLVDYIPSGYSFDPMFNPNWTLQGNKAYYRYFGNLNPADSLIQNIVLKILPTNSSRNWINEAEVSGISVFSIHNLNISQDDFDSYSDEILGNDPGGKVNTSSDDQISDDGVDTDGDGIQDEDDHDPAVINIWDLALTKKIISPKPHYPGDNIQFEISIFNQGTDTLGQITVVDYIPIGLEFDPNVNPGWLKSGKYAFRTMQVHVAPDSSFRFPIILKLKHGNRPITDWINYAEISESYNSRGLNTTGFDIDSKEMSDQQFERAVLPGSISDNNISSTDIFGEEDDHDPDMPAIFDLALRKYLSPEKIFHYGDTAEFIISVHNQGVIPCKQFLITDYIPSGYNWIPQNNWSYISAPRHGKYQWNGLLLSGDSVQIHLKLLIKSIYSGGLDLLNLAELTSAIDTSGTIYIKDIDSYYDADPLNDSGGKVNTLSDNFIEDDGIDRDRDNIQDEDDHDPALTPIVDFALRKEILNPDKGNYGDTIEFKITVFNQGNINANSIEIKDYLNKGYSFPPNLNPGWQLNGVNPVYSFKNIFLPGQKMETTLRLIVESDTSIASFYNWAEITGSTDLNGSQIGHKDADSNPASDNSNERKVIPGDVNDDNIFGGGPLVNEDEDDHDVAGLNSKGSIGDMVWHDKNANGIMDLGEEGIEGISVQLYSSPGNIFVRATKTNKSGKYLFDQVNPGKYYLKFIVNNPWSITDPNKTIDTLDSDVGNFNGVATTETTMLMGGENDKSWDLGLYKCIPITGYVFFDINQNGIYDLTENGINGLKVYAHDATSGQMVSSTKTFVSDGKIYHDGYFYFCLKPGSYYIRLQALDGFMISPYHQGTDPNFDSDLTNQFGPFTTGIYSGISCDTIKGIGGGVYHPLFKLQSNKDTRINSEYEINSRSSYSENLILQGQQLATRNILRWTKTSKSCLRYLQILRKESNNDQFESIGFVKTDSSELNPQSCPQEWSDLKAIQALEYEYKLIGLDMDFNVLTSNSITIGNEIDPVGQEHGFDLHPNPAKENIFIYSTNWNDPILAYQVMDIFGTIVKKSNPLNLDFNGKPIEIPLDDLPKGQYFIKAYFRNATKVRGFQLY